MLFLLVIFVHFISFSLFLSQFSSPYAVIQTGGHKPSPVSPAPLPSVYSSSESTMSSTYYSHSPHRPSLPLIPHSAMPSMSTLGTPQTPLSTPQHVPSVAFPLPFFAMSVSSAVPQQQGSPSTCQPNLSFHSTHPLPLSQVQPTPYPAPNPEHGLAEQPVQVNISLSSHCNGWLDHRKSVILRWNGCDACWAWV